MKRKKTLIALLILALTLVGVTGLSQAQGPEPQGGGSPGMGTAFTYQGHLVDDGSPAEGAYDLEFKLYDAEGGGNQVSTVVLQDDLMLSDGYFTVALDFGAGAFNGDARWLQIGVRPGGSGGGYTTLSPRQALRPAPYAIYAGAGENGGHWSLTGNAGTDPSIHFVGTTDYRPLEFRVNDERALRLEPVYPDTTPNVIGGHTSNAVTFGHSGVAIGGGGTGGAAHLVSHDYSTIGGGKGNSAGGPGATIGGGMANDAQQMGATVGGGYTNTVATQYATIGGGELNMVSGTHGTIGGGYRNTARGPYVTIGGGRWHAAVEQYATIGGGHLHEASGAYATIAGGDNHRASGDWATVPGGRTNHATGDYSFAAGRQARAAHDGSFVWADSTGTDLVSTAEDQFLVRANGGAVFEGANESTAMLHVTNRGSSIAIQSSGGSHGLYSMGSEVGVYGGSGSGTGVYGTGRTYGVRGVSPLGVGVYARSDSGNLIEAYSSASDREFYVTNSGDVYIDGTFNPGGADFAELLPAAEGLEPGDVLAIGADGQLARSTQAHQPTVAGVYSTQPGILGGADEDLAGKVRPAGKVPLAVVGIVPVKASAENGAIRPGDLLTASDTPGHAMAAGPNPAVGTVIGKALQGLEQGRGVIQMLVVMQ